MRAEVIDKRKFSGGDSSVSTGDGLSFPGIWAHVGVFLAGVACFANSYDATFAFDDSEAIINNRDVNPTSSNISDLFFHDFWGSKLDSNLSHKSYRPLTVLTFRLNYLLSGGLYPMGFHVVNILLHGIVSSVFLSVFAIVAGDGNGRLHSSHGSTSILCALMFALHPIHTENVAAVVGRADLMCSLCFLLAFISYAKSLRSDFSHLRRFFHSLLVIPFVVCSVLFKEQGITVLGICVAYDVLMVSRIHPRTILCFVFEFCGLKAQHSKHIKESSHVIWKLVGRSFAIVLLGFTILLVRWKMMGSQTPTFQPVDNPHSFINNTLFRVINYNYLYALNAWILLNPWWLCFDWSMGCVPVIDHPTDLRLLAVFFFLLCFFCLLTSAAFQKPSPDQRFLAMALTFLVLPFLPASNILFRVGFVIAERNLYLSSAGFIMIIVLGIRILSETKKQVCVFFVAFLLVSHFSRSVQRSSHWRNEKILFETGAQVCPLNAKVHYNIAKLSADEGNIDVAIKRYQLALSLNPKYDQAMNNLGNLFKDRGQLVEAELLLQRATETRSDFAAAWMNLGIVQASLKKYHLSEQSYLTALQHRKKYPDCYYNLGNLYLELGRHEEALSAWQNATYQKPTHLSAWTNLMLLLDNLGRMKDLELVVSVALEHNPNEPSIHYNYASALGKISSFTESEKHFLLAIQFNDKVATYHSNLGVLYHRWGKLDLAERQYKIALALEPNSKQTMENLQLLYKKQNKMV